MCRLVWNILLLFFRCQEVYDDISSLIPDIGNLGLPRWHRGKESACQCRRHQRLRGFYPWVGKITWRRKWQPTPAFLPGESHGQQSLAGCKPSRAWGCKQLDMTECTSMHTGNVSSLSLIVLLKIDQFCHPFQRSRFLLDIFSLLFFPFQFHWFLVFFTLVLGSFCSFSPPIVSLKNSFLEMVA